MGRAGSRRMGAAEWYGAVEIGPDPAFERVMPVARYILLGLLVTQLADAATFTLGVSRYGIALESNGLAAGIFHAAGLEGLLLAKAVVIVATIGLLALSSTRFPRLLVWGGAAATAMGLLGFLTNTASILLLG